MIEFFNYLNPILMCFASICWIYLYSKTSKHVHKIILYNNLINHKMNNIALGADINSEYMQALEHKIRETLNG